MMTVKIPSVSRRQKSRRTTPKLTLLLNQQKQLQRSPQYGQKKKKRIRLVLVLAAVVILQVMLLRSVKIENRIHEETITGEDNGTLKTRTALKPQSIIPNNNAAEDRQLLLPKPFVVQESSFLYDLPPQIDEFPQWIQTYTKWHRQVRQEFPGMQLFQNPKAPHLLIRTCLGLCGGLHDRIGQLPWDLYLAHKTKRVLLIAWQRPRSLENFLVPSGLMDWRVPEEAKFGFADIRRVRNETQLFEGFPEANPTDEFFSKDFDIALERATTGSFANVHVLRHRLLGHLYQDVLEERLQKEMPDSQTLHVPPLFGKIFWLFFRPSQPVHDKFVGVMNDLRLTPQAYTAVHCRVRHPKAFSYGATVLGKNPNYPADKTGLPWEGETRKAALGVALKALQCAKSISSSSKNSTYSPVYFLSDSNDLVSHITQELPAMDSTDTKTYNWSLPQLRQLLASKTNGLAVQSRDPTEENAHIDRQKGRPPDAYFDTFVDLLVVIHAQCVVYGIGYYAAFGAKISGTSCQYVYQQEAWGAQAMKGAEVCPDAE